MSAPNAGKRYPAEVMTPAEVAAIIGACPALARTGIRNRALLTLMYRSGLRVSEGLALRPSDIDLAQRSIRVLDGKGHTFAVELEHAGTPATVISKLLGHSSVAVTARYLDHLTNHQAVTALGATELPALGG
jgi:site-specific recombinase XerD